MDNALTNLLETMNGHNENAVGWWIGGVLVSILLFFLVREFLCWYWKINHRLSALEALSRRLENLDFASASRLAVGEKTCEELEAIRTRLDALATALSATAADNGETWAQPVPSCPTGKD